MKKNISKFVLLMVFPILFGGCDNKSTATKQNSEISPIINEEAKPAPPDSARPPEPSGNSIIVC